jgi:hypothetical protein
MCKKSMHIKPPESTGFFFVTSAMLSREILSHYIPSHPVALQLSAPVEIPPEGRDWVWCNVVAAAVIIGNTPGSPIKARNGDPSRNGQRLGPIDIRPWLRFRIPRTRFRGSFILKFKDPFNFFSSVAWVGLAWAFWFRRIFRRKCEREERERLMRNEIRIATISSGESR